MFHSTAKARPRFKLGNKLVSRVDWAKVAWDASILNQLLKLQQRAKERVANQLHASQAPHGDPGTSKVPS